MKGQYRQERLMPCQSAQIKGAEVIGLHRIEWGSMRSIWHK